MAGPINIKTAILLAKPNGRDPRARRTLHFFATKGFLSNMPPPRPYRGLLNLEEAIWTCENLAPALYEILPVAVIRFPNHLEGILPADLREVIGLLRSGATDGPSYKGHPFWRLRDWADLETTDRRASIRATRRVHFNLPLNLHAKIKELSETIQQTQTEVVVTALRYYFDSGAPHRSKRGRCW